jgi:hypothetical protein
VSQPLHPAIEIRKRLSNNTAPFGSVEVRSSSEAQFLRFHASVRERLIALPSTGDSQPRPQGNEKHSAEGNSFLHTIAIVPVEFSIQG